MTTKPTVERLHYLKENEDILYKPSVQNLSDIFTCIHLKNYIYLCCPELRELLSMSFPKICNIIKIKMVAKTCHH